MTGIGDEGKINYILSRNIPASRRRPAVVGRLAPRFLTERRPVGSESQVEFVPRRSGADAQIWVIQAKRTAPPCPQYLCHPIVSSQAPVRSALVRAAEVANAAQAWAQLLR